MSISEKMEIFLKMHRNVDELEHKYNSVQNQDASYVAVEKGDSLKTG